MQTVNVCLGERPVVGKEEWVFQIPSFYNQETGYSDLKIPFWGKSRTRYKFLEDGRKLVLYSWDNKFREVSLSMDEVIEQKINWITLYLKKCGLTIEDVNHL
jgi:hypothetical protein